jgi:hypothetical protein
MIENAIKEKSKMSYQPVGLICCQRISFFRIGNLYCIILDKEIDRRNF